MVKLFLHDGRVDVNKLDDWDRTPVYAAARSNNLLSLEYILALRRNVNLLQKTNDDLDSESEETAFGIAEKLWHEEYSQLLTDYQQNPLSVSIQLRAKHNIQGPYKDDDGTELFLLSVLNSDGYLDLDPKIQKDQPICRFFNILKKLPQELQMVIANRVQLTSFLQNRLTMLFSA